MQKPMAVSRSVPRPRGSRITSIRSALIARIVISNFEGGRGMPILSDTRIRTITRGGSVFRASFVRRSLYRRVTFYNFEKSSRDYEKTLLVYLTRECTNRCLPLITNAEANIRINESAPTRTKSRKRY